MKTALTLILVSLAAISFQAGAKFGERVQIRKAMHEDLPSLEQLFFTMEMRDFYFMGEPKDPAAWIESSRRGVTVPFQAVRSNDFVIADPMTNEFRGIISDVVNSDLGTHELSYAISREYRSQGLAGAALDHMIDRAFREDPDGTIIATVLAANEPSRNLLLSKGFKQISGFKTQTFELTIKCEALVVKPRTSQGN